MSATSLDRKTNRCFNFTLDAVVAAAAAAVADDVAVAAAAAAAAFLN